MNLSKAVRVPDTLADEIIDLNGPRAFQDARAAFEVEWIELAAREPHWTEPDPHDPSIERRFRAIEEFGGRVLRVACVETEASIRIISAMFDRNARRTS